MAIKIPSKNIYEINNPKIRDNVINTVNVEQTIIKPNNEYETPVFNGQFQELSYTNREAENAKTVGKVVYAGADIGYSAIWIANAETIEHETHLVQISINKLLKNKYIDKVFYEKDKDGNNQIKYTVYGDIKEGTCFRSIGWDVPDGFVQPEMEARITSVGKTTYNDDLELKEEDVAFDFSRKIYSSIKGTPNEMVFEQEVSCELTPLDVSFVSSYQDDTVNDKFLINFEVMCKRTVIKTAGMSFDMGLSGTVVCEGTYLKYEPKQIEITAYGNTVGIDLADGSVSYIKSGSLIEKGTSDKPFTIEGNELMQESSRVIGTGDKNAKHRAGLLLNQYAKGKETATLLCDINEYIKEHNDEISIGLEYVRITQSSFYYRLTCSIEKPHIRDINIEILATSTTGIKSRYNITIINGETSVTRNLLTGLTYNKDGIEIISATSIVDGIIGLRENVIPYVYGADGTDQPMSKYQDGTPKVFEVTGTKMIYDGAVWQELTLQEKRQ